MNMISTGAFQDEMNASNKQTSIAEKFAAVWEKKNAKAARAGGVSLMALSLAACGSDSTTSTSTDSSTSTTTTTVDANTNSVLTTGIDVIAGGSGSDTVSGSQTTLNAGDSISGGAGADMLAIFTSAASTIGGFSSTDVETISASATVGALTVNMGNVSGETAVRVTGSDQNVTFSNTDNIATLELQYNSAGNATVTYNAATVVGTADSMSLALTDTTNGVVTIAGIETLNVSNSGTSTITTVTTTAATTVNLTGSGTVTLTDLDDATTTLDASAYTGTSTMGGFGATNAMTITGGSGADTINMVGLTSGDTIDAGAGADTLALAFAGATNSVVTSTVAGDVTVSNVETLALSSDTNGDAIDFDAFSAPAFDKVMVTITADADDVALNDTQSSTFHLRNTNGSGSDNVDFLTIDLKDSSGTADTIALTLQNRDINENMTIATLTGAGIENINITADVASTTGGSSAVAGDITVTNFTYAASEAITVTGDADFTISSTLAAGVVTYDASTATGDQNVTFGASNMTATGGSGADTFNFAATLNGSDVVDGGAGIDTVTAVNVNDGAAYDADLQLTNVERLTLTENESSDSALTVDMNGTSLARITITADHQNATAQKIEDLGGADTDLYLLGVSSGAGSVEVDLSTDGSADNIDVFLAPTTSAKFVGTITVNDAETINVDVAAGAATMSQTIADIDAADATTVVFTNDDTWDAGDIFALTANSIKTGATIDFSGYNQSIGNAASLVDVAGTDGTASTVGAVADAATAMGTDGFTAVATGSYTILLGDGRTENADVETTINLGASNTGADTIRFVNSTADTTNDVGVVVIDNFNTAAGSTATHRSVIDLSAFTGVETIADVTITAGELNDGEDVAILSATTSTDFAGTITLLGVTATTLSASDFVF